MSEFATASKRRPRYAATTAGRGGTPEALLAAARGRARAAGWRESARDGMPHDCRRNSASERGIRPVRWSVGVACKCCHKENQILVATTSTMLVLPQPVVSTDSNLTSFTSLFGSYIAWKLRAAVRGETLSHPRHNAYMYSQATPENRRCRHRRRRRPSQAHQNYWQHRRPWHHRPNPISGSKRSYSSKSSKGVSPNTHATGPVSRCVYSNFY